MEIGDRHEKWTSYSRVIITPFLDEIYALGEQRWTCTRHRAGEKIVGLHRAAILWGYPEVSVKIWC
jgi:hypothetical protein